MATISKTESAPIQQSDLAKLADANNYLPLERWVATLFLNGLLSLLELLDFPSKTANTFGREVNLPTVPYLTDSIIEHLRLLRLLAPLFNMPIQLHNAVAKPLGLPNIVYPSEIVDAIVLKLAHMR